MDRQLENAYESVLRRNPGEAEFHQAVREIFESLGPGARHESAVRGGSRVVAHLRTGTPDHFPGAVG